MISSSDTIKGKTEYEISCDVCSTGSEHVTAKDFNHMLADIKDRGWSIPFNVKTGVFDHKCPGCNGRRR
jgi:hypothetical protein